MAAKKQENRKKIIVFCLIFLLAASVVGVSIWYICSLRTEETQVGRENDNTSDLDDNHSKDDESDENANDETDTDEQEEEQDAMSDDTTDNGAYTYGGFDNESVEDEDNTSDNASLDDMKQYPTDPVVTDKDWEV